ncbi:cytochrome P450 [Mycena vulgaris]|nr:cytochrome P450 [Mycena vulgaris]
MWSAVLGFAVPSAFSRVYTRYVAALNLHNHLPGLDQFFDPQSPIGSLIPTLTGWKIVSPQAFHRFSLVNRLIWGDSIASSSGEMWKRHRRIVVPAFNARNYSLVAAESIGTYKIMSSVEGWESEEEILIPEINPIILRFTFIIMAKCGFGLPRWNSVIHLMGKLVLTRKEDLSLENETDQNNDIFSRLTANMLSIMFAGNETSASVLVTTLVCLALYQDEQDKAFAEIQHIIPPGREPELDDVKSFVHISACMQEAQRLIPALLLMPRDVMENVTVKVTHPAEGFVTFQKGARVVVDDIAIREPPCLFLITIRNYFPEPDKYLPSRWYGRPEYDNPEFGFGPRACIGRKFAQIESTLFLCLLLRDWKLDIVLKDGETVIEYEERVLGNASLVGTAFGLGPVPLKLSRRH